MSKMKVMNEMNKISKMGKSCVASRKRLSHKKCQVMASNKKKYAVIYYNDGSGDNVPAIVGAMSMLDINKKPEFIIK